MTLGDALRALDAGKSVVSNVGKTYRREDVAPINWIGEYAASFRSAGMTEGERRGTFKNADQ
ncbi:hypothetical protein BBD42_15305 [Paenibacillus sp. BIHB 4019]|uniref:Uncharacterized protein n=1 Tax=Paenibacillus sp. BIHB 4019 TaxID=1870819 RepID=A0A1B2DJ11_9BACL|nr:hypothetical protein [Paenibacillus sp. BIHB 4019]ANY67679.1 hypothetical protein BBD42_15305 [Paenibacillus sp. BIHB 4019]